MPDKDAGLVAQGVAAVAALSAIAFAFIKSTNLSKEMREFKKDVGATMSAQDVKIEAVDRRLDELEKSMPIQFAQAKAFNIATFPTKPAIDEKFKNQDMLSAERFEQLSKQHHELASQTKEIFKVLTDMRDKEIQELKERNRELERRNGQQP